MTKDLTYQLLLELFVCSLVVWQSIRPRQRGWETPSLQIFLRLLSANPLFVDSLYKGERGLREGNA
jgi:hypothetical protein